MRRFPQLMAGLPFPFGSLYAPVVSGREKFGVLVVLRPATPGHPVDARRPAADAQRREAARRRPRRAGRATERPSSGTANRCPSSCPRSPRRRCGSATSTGTSTAAPYPPTRSCARFSAPIRRPSAAPSRHWRQRLAPEDVYGLWAVARQAVGVGQAGLAQDAAARPGRTAAPARTLRPRAPTRRRPGQPSDRIPGGPRHRADRRPRRPTGSRAASSRSTGSGGSPMSTTARRPCSAAPRSELAGRVLWEVLPWFGHPAYEDHYRAALLSRDPVHFMARRAPEDWLSVSLYPGHDGVTVTLTPRTSPRTRRGPSPCPAPDSAPRPTGRRRCTARSPWPSR